MRFGHRGRLAFVLTTLAFFCTLATLAIPVEVESRAEACAVDFGYPIHFVTADTALTPPPGSWVAHYDPWEYPADFHWGRFFASWASVALLVSSPFMVGARRRARGRLRRPSARPS